jgi:hypothetical protein
MNKNILYIATASWESRYLEGAKRTIPTYQCNKALCFWFSDYEERTQPNRDAFVKEFDALKPKMEKLRLLGKDGDPQADAALWLRIYEVIKDSLVGVDSFVFDITTTPRVALWIIIDLLSVAKLPGVICYHKALSHGEWCGCEPDRPVIVPKLGGIGGLDRNTKLLVITGFDEDRSEHFMTHFEPEETLILLQDGSPKDPQRNRAPHLKRFEGRSGVTIRVMNSYSPDWGYSALEEAAVDFGKDSNLVLASVGPKTSAVSLYLLHRRLTYSSLVYSPCREYNSEYSTGIGETMEMQWPPAGIQFSLSEDGTNSKLS